MTQPNESKRKRVIHDERADLCRPCAQRDANADFADAFHRRVSEHAVESDAGETERERGENGKQEGEQTLGRPGFRHQIGHGANFVNRLAWIDAGDGVAQ